MKNLLSLVLALYLTIHSDTEAMKGWLDSKFFTDVKIQKVEKGPFGPFGNKVGEYYKVTGDTSYNNCGRCIVWFRFWDGMEVKEILGDENTD